MTARLWLQDRIVGHLAPPRSVSCAFSSSACFSYLCPQSSLKIQPTGRTFPFAIMISLRFALSRKITG